jgi:type IV pilus assembly protein PilP
MEKRHKIILKISVVLIFSFLLWACGKKEEAPEKPKTISKKIVSKKISKPVPKKVKKVRKEPPEAKELNAESKEAPTSKKEIVASKTPKKADKGEKQNVSTTTLTAKKKPAFEPKFEISTKSDYKITPVASVQTVKAKIPEASKKPEAKKVDLTAKIDKEPTPKLQKETAETAESSKKADAKAQDKDSSKDISKDKLKDMTAAAEDETGSLSGEAKKAAAAEEESTAVARLTPSKTLQPVEIKPLTKDYKYDLEGKIDPFSSLFKVKSQKKKKRKRYPLTPLEKRDISQFKLVGIILSAKGNKAIVKEASGKGYVISRGTYIGVNDGRVVRILKDKVICEEEVENLFGQTQMKSRILKLQKPPGAL